MVVHPPVEDVSTEAAKLLLSDLSAVEGTGERLAPDLYEAPVAEVEHVHC